MKKKKNKEDLYIGAENTFIWFDGYQIIAFDSLVTRTLMNDERYNPIHYKSSSFIGLEYPHLLFSPHLLYSFGNIMWSLKTL